MSELASQMISQIGTIFDRINVSPSHAITAFPLEGAQNYLYVLYSANGMPLLAGAIVDSMDRREQNRAMREIQGLASSGFATSFRVVELGSDEMARHVERWVKELFEAALPLADGFGLAIASASSTGGIVPARPTGRRGRPRKSEAAEPATESTAPRRRGRPRKSEADATETPTATPARRRGRPSKAASSATPATESAAPRRRGRPRKNETAETPAPAKRRGRPAKNADAGAPASTGARRGRPRKNAEPAVEGATKRRGRPRKSEEGGAAPASTGARRGRPKKNAEAPEATSEPKRRGRPRKSAEEGTENAGASKRRGRPRKNADQNGGEGAASTSSDNA